MLRYVATMLSGQNSIKVFFLPTIARGEPTHTYARAKPDLVSRPGPKVGHTRFEL